MSASSLAFPKQRPRLLDKLERKADLDAKDRIERKKCRARSGGQCEVIAVMFRSLEERDDYLHRCPRRASQNHHLIGGSGKRNKGKSILAEHRIDTCDKCHDEITGNVLVPVNRYEREDAATVKYERIK